MRLREHGVALLRSPYLWAIAVRVIVFALLSPIEFRGDGADYVTMASNLALGHGFSRCPVAPFPLTAQRPPLFSLLLAGLFMLGAGPLWASFALNLLCDLVSMRLVSRWAAENLASSGIARRAAWGIALCPLLLTYAPYSTTENLSLALFLAATLLTFRIGRRGADANAFRWAASAGLFWGLLALCRSYFLLFPFVLLLIPSARAWKRTAMAVMIVASLAAPSVWVARNTVAFGRPSFSQGSTVGWQSYQGLCFTNFDWWNQDDVQRIYGHPILSKMMGSNCVPDEQVGALDAQVRDEVIQDCVLDHPARAALNAAVKGAMLFINWGQFLPYTDLPALLRWSINAFLVLYWGCAIWALWRRRHGKAKESPATTYAVTGLLYVLAVTLPFAVDARYLLGPFVLTLVAAVDAAGGWGALFKPWGRGASRPSRRGSRIL